MPYDPALAPGVRRIAGNLGINPSDLLTAMSYESGGTLDPNQWGGAGGKMLGLIQFNPENQKKYGVVPGMPLDKHLDAVENYLRDRGVQPGMGLLDTYSAINAGRPGLYNASDANNGGAPGTVADKVATQMVGHRARANSMLGEDSAPISVAPGVQQQQVSQAEALAPAPGAEGPVAPAPGAQTPSGSFDVDKLLAAAANYKSPQQQQQDDPVMPIATALPPGLAAAQRLAAINSSLSRKV